MYLTTTLTSLLTITLVATALTVIPSALESVSPTFDILSILRLKFSYLHASSLPSSNETPYHLDDAHGSSKWRTPSKHIKGIDILECDKNHPGAGSEECGFADSSINRTISRGDLTVVNGGQP
jgi:hypothetical protein